MSKNNEKNIEKSLNTFLDDDKNTEKSEKKFIDEREGLIERVDKIFITKNGKQLLREQY